MDLPVQEVGDQLVHEVEELEAAAALGMLALIVPVATSSAANSVVVPRRVYVAWPGASGRWAA